MRKNNFKKRRKTMTYYVVAGPRRCDIGYSGSYTMPGKAVYLEGHVYDTLRLCINHIYRDYKSPQDYAKAVASYQTRIDALQSSLNSVNTQCSQANTASAAAQSRCQALESTLQIERQKVTVLTQQNAALLATQATLQQRLQGEASAMEVAAANIAELKQALQQQQAAVTDKNAKIQQLTCAQEQLESDVAELKGRLAVQREEHNSEVKQLCKEHEKNVAIMFKKIEAMLNMMNPTTSDVEDS